MPRRTRRGIARIHLARCTALWREIKWASMQKTIYSLPALRELLADANRRHLELLPSIDDPRNGRDRLDKLSQTVHKEDRAYSRFNLFDHDDEALLLGIARGEFSTSAASKTNRCSAFYGARTAVRSPGCSSVSACSASSRKRVEPTSTA